jgi:hypothetical protein
MMYSDGLLVAVQNTLSPDWLPSTCKVPLCLVQYVMEVSSILRSRVFNSNSRNEPQCDLNLQILATYASSNRPAYDCLK